MAHNASDGPAMRVFVSSIVGGYEEYRTAAQDAIKALDHEAVLMERTHPSSPAPSRGECLREIEDSDVVVLLLGSRYGTPEKSGKSPTHEEFEHARGVGKPILVFVEDVVDRDVAQSDFLAEISGWEDGYFRTKYSAPITLVTEIVKALTALATQAEAAADTGPKDRLPPVCRSRIESLRESSPDDADRLVELLSDPASRKPDVLSHLAGNPRGWLAHAGYAVWEAISDFIDAHDLGDSEPTRRLAIEAASPRSNLYCIRHAVSCAEEGDQARAEALLAQVAPDHPLMPAARAVIADDPTAVVEAISIAGLHEVDDPEVARYCIARLVRAHLRNDRPDLATEVLRDANQRFPGRAWLLFHQANTTFGMVDPSRLGSAEGHDLLSEAAELALRSRDLFRSWNGPSHVAVAVAMRAMLAMDDPQRAVDLATLQPHGEATESEAAAAGVRAVLAEALLALGRFSDIDSLLLEGLEESERTLIRAMQAAGEGDQSAPATIRRAVAQAADEPSRLRALYWLASVGEIDEEALPQVRESDAALFRGVAALRKGDFADAVHILLPFRLGSPVHASYLARAQHQAECMNDAVTTLREAAEHLGDPSLLEQAAELLFEERRLDEAEPLATEALAQVPARAARQRLARLLAAIAQLRPDWPAMESYARAVVRDSPQDEQAAWAVVYALHQQVKNQQAWAYIVAHNLVPFDEDTAQLAIVVCNTVDAPQQDAGHILEIAGMYTNSEQVTGRAIAALMTGSERFRLSDAQRSQLRELMEDFLARFPDSDALRSISVEQPEELLDMMGNLARADMEKLGPLIEHVQFGRVPYGALRWVRDLPYAELLLTMAAGCITAIPVGEEQLQRERRAAAAAIGTAITIDTSVVAVGIRADLDVHELARAFETVLVGDELIFDARLAVITASQPVAGYASYDPVLGRATMSPVDERQRATMRDRVERAVQNLESWQSVRSGLLQPPDGTEEDNCRPWDASIRVALDRQCALWCDDLALRVAAESVGITTFGTWALYEALRLTPAGKSLPPPLEMKALLLRARIADVPISLAELAEAADQHDSPDEIVGAYLGRPLTWTRALTETTDWFLERVSGLTAEEHHQRVPGLLHAAAHGLGAATDSARRCDAIGALLAVTIRRVADPATVPALVAASRYAARQLDPGSDGDPLECAAKNLVSALEKAIGTGLAAQAIVRMFSEAEPADRQTVASIVLGDR